jgi:hypothetical protein
MGIKYIDIRLLNVILYVSMDCLLFYSTENVKTSCIIRGSVR